MLPVIVGSQFANCELLAIERSDAVSVNHALFGNEQFLEFRLRNKKAPGFPGASSFSVGVGRLGAFFPGTA